MTLAHAPGGALGEFPRTERCVCGGSITVAAPGFPGQIEVAVRAHNLTREHVAWRGGADGREPLRPVVRTRGWVLENGQAVPLG